jgi:hypothetical protein
METPKCPKCSQPMDEGFIVDHAGFAATQAHWVKGRARLSFLLWAKFDWKARRRVATFCCPKCGFLESYLQSAVE